ncbi:mechanosensitive ion channel family protein, partial [Psychrobacter sp. SIMBA_152]
ANVVSIAYDYSYKAREVPITGVIQVIKLVLVLMAIIITIAIIMNKSPMYLLSGFGAMTAILMVVFRDTLMGFVAGVQLATNRMVAIGDWIELTDHGVDGTVQEVGLIS